MTSNQIAFNTLQETIRSNKAKEAETMRSNLAKETETNRSNVASETETKRANVTKEQETQRHNQKEEETNRVKSLNNPFSIISSWMTGAQNPFKDIGEFLGIGETNLEKAIDALNKSISNASI